MQLPLLLGTCSVAFNTTIHLPSYGIYDGTTLTKEFTTNTTLPQPVNAWLNVEYATQPVGQYRFARAPRAQPFDGTREAKDYGLVCMQDPAHVASFAMGEDCLTLNIFRPAGVPLEQKLPVAFYIHGGAFNYGYASMFGAESFVAKAEKPVMAVNFGYRLGTFGFPTSPAFDDLDLLNLGLTDQFLALQFVQENIGYFGGDAEQVTIMGLSAGAHSVGYHYLNIDNGPPLFSKAVMFSGGPTARAFPDASYPLYIEQWTKLVSEVGCEGIVSNDELLQCLKEAELDVLNKAQYEIFNLYDYNITWPWQPTLGGPLLPRPAHISWSQGLFNKLPLITGFCNDEGRFYAPQNLSTNSQFLGFFQTLAPSLTPSHLEQLNTLYPDPVTSPEISPYTNSPLSPQFSRLAAAYGDFSYICCAQETASRVVDAGVEEVWKYRFNTNNSWPSWEGIPHSCDSKYEVDSSSVQSPEIGGLYHGFLVAFVSGGDPNGFSRAKEVGERGWERYGAEDGGKQMLFVEGGSGMEGDAMRREQCEFWRAILGELER